MLSHNLKGTREANGFPELTRIGGLTEAEAETRRQCEVRAAVHELTPYVNAVR